MPKPDYTGGAGGAISGAATGSMIAGPYGAIAGGLFGAGAGLFGGISRKKKKLSFLDKQQQALNTSQHEAVLGQGPLADLYNYNPEGANDVFEKTIANPAYRNFKEKLAPEVTGQFRSHGLMNSSYAGDALSKLARDVQEGLDAQRTQYLYGEQKDARTAKRSAVENLQNRQTFAYDTSAPASSGIDSILKSLTPENIEEFKKYFKETPTPGAV